MLTSPAMKHGCISSVFGNYLNLYELLVQKNRAKNDSLCLSKLHHKNVIHLGLSLLEICSGNSLSMLSGRPRKLNKRNLPLSKSIPTHPVPIAVTKNISEPCQMSPGRPDPTRWKQPTGHRENTQKCQLLSSVRLKNTVTFMLTPEVPLSTQHRCDLCNIS